MPARGDIAVRLANGDDAYRLIVSDLASLIDHAQASLRLIESAIDREAHLSARLCPPMSSCSTMSVKTGAALKARDVDLGTALYSLIDSEAVPHGSRWPFLRERDGRRG